ncbi:MAG TPA: AraC family transcriptional regulator [Bacteroidetes bacterium]|nr:AraC family transcriptional regulator [Bacteroidota bacterium]
MANNDQDFLSRIQMTVEENLSNPNFTAEDLCDQVFLSRSQCHRKLKSLLGMSATEYIRQQRLERAAELLQSQKWRVAEVVLAVGFDHHSYFAKCFREQYGCCPSEYAGG